MRVAIVLIAMTILMSCSAPKCAGVKNHPNYKKSWSKK